MIKTKLVLIEILYCENHGVALSGPRALKDDKNRKISFKYYYYEVYN